ncbi:C40 family peptidase [Saccharothrix sp. ST-888]|uniref:C40 family peptidase n=1 Tax=Saccharothrix sp. ST-888 TaxID=1427391 RepID=UPI00069720E3|nr:NlpC/P60 family protein [Saccharothrix sp. ST-888]
MARRLLPTLLLSLSGLLGLLPTAAAAPSTRAIAPALPLPAVAADDPYPSADHVAQAEADATVKAGSSAAIEARLTAAQTELADAGRAAEQAVEAYNGAQARLAKARTESAAAARRAAAAEVDRTDAAERAAQLAAETYRQGTSAELSAINALLGSKGPRAAGDQATAVGVAGARTREILDTATAAVAAAARTSAAAHEAEQAAVRATEAVREAKEQTQRRLAAQQAQVAEIADRREHLLAELAAARNTAVELERQRREALESIAERAAEEAARAAAEAVAAAPNPSADSAWSAGGAEGVIAFARSKIGLPYIWGGEGPAGYDCSGLTMMAWQRGGKPLTHFAATQYAESTPIGYHQLRPGDLVFWTHTGRAADIYHVAIYIGDDQMIEAPRPGMAIKQASLWIMGRPDFYGRP